MNYIYLSGLIFMSMVPSSVLVASSFEGASHEIPIGQTFSTFSSEENDGYCEEDEFFYSSDEEAVDLGSEEKDLSGRFRFECGGRSSEINRFDSDGSRYEVVSQKVLSEVRFTESELGAYADVFSLHDSDMPDSPKTNNQIIDRIFDKLVAEQKEKLSESKSVDSDGNKNEVVSPKGLITVTLTESELEDYMDGRSQYDSDVPYDPKADNQIIDRMFDKLKEQQSEGNATLEAGDKE